MNKMVYSAAMTPLNSEGELDRNSLTRMLERNIAHGISGFFFFGNMGEWNQFELEFKKDMLSEGSKIIQGRAEVIFGLNATGLRLCRRNFEMVKDLDFDSYAVCMPPPLTSRIEPLDYLTEILEMADRPVYYYHNPVTSSRALSLDDLRKIITHPKLKGVKNSAGDFRIRKEMLMLKDEHDFILFEGHEWAVEEAMILGCDGTLCGSGSLLSKPMVMIARAVDNGDYAEAMAIQKKIIKVFHSVYAPNVTTVWVGLKYALKCLGVFENDLTLVQENSVLTDERKKIIDAALVEYADFID